MTHSAGSAGHSLRRTLEAFAARIQREDIRVGELMMLWAMSFLVVVIAVAVFFIPLVWIFS